MRSDASLFDVLVIGSGASGLAAAVAADGAGARVALATKTTLQACNSAKAQGGIQAAFGDDDSPEIHAEDVIRSSHDTADPRLVEVLTSEAPSAIHWLEELGVEFTRANGGCPLAASPAAEARAASGCSRSATARGTRSRRRFGRRTRPAPESSFLTTLSLRWSRAPPAGERRSRRRRASSRSTSAPSCSRPVGAATRRPKRAASLHEPSQCDRRDDSHRRRGRRGDAGPRCAPVPPERRRLAGDDAATSIPETTRAYGAVL